MTSCSCLVTTCVLDIPLLISAIHYLVGRWDHLRAVVRVAHRVVRLVVCVKSQHHLQLSDKRCRFELLHWIWTPLDQYQEGSGFMGSHFAIR